MRHWEERPLHPQLPCRRQRLVWHDQHHVSCWMLQRGYQMACYCSARTQYRYQWWRQACQGWRARPATVGACAGSGSWRPAGNHCHGRCSGVSPPALGCLQHPRDRCQHCCRRRGWFHDRHRGSCRHAAHTTRRLARVPPGRRNDAQRCCRPHRARLAHHTRCQRHTTVWARCQPSAARHARRPPVARPGGWRRCRR